MATPYSYERGIRDELGTEHLTTKELAAAVARTAIPPHIHTDDLEAGFRMGLEEALRTTVPGEELELPSDRAANRKAYMAEFRARVAARVIGEEE